MSTNRLRSITLPSQGCSGHCPACLPAPLTATRAQGALLAGGRGKVYVPAIKKAKEGAGFTFRNVFTLRCQCLKISAGSISF